MRAKLLTFVGAAVLALIGTLSVAQEPKQEPKQPDASNFSIVGSWKGTFKVSDLVTFDVRTTFREDKTYTTTSISSVPSVTSESGTYSYQYQSEDFGVLTSKPAPNGFAIEVAAKITWNNGDQFVYEGAGRRITMNRVRMLSGK